MVKLIESPVLHATRHNPRGAVYRFDEACVKDLVQAWQGDQRSEILNQILLRSHDLIHGIILSRSSYLEDLDELVSLIQIRIWKKLPLFDATRGRLFTFLTLCVHQGLDEVWTKRTNHKERHLSTGLDVLDFLESQEAAPDSREGMEEVNYRIMQVKTTCTDEYELKAQKWLVLGFIDSSFSLKRHEVADAMTLVYNLSPARSRSLHDQTLLEVRRQLLGVVEIPEVDVSDLRGTRQTALIRYASQLSADDFSKLVYLMKNLAPAIIEEGRIDWILNGYPGAVSLFYPLGNYSV